MSGFTKGPWLMAAKPSSVVGWPIVATPSGRSICSLNYVQHSNIDPKVSGDDAFNRESRANGLLIASAPDLLEALHGLNGILGTAESNASGTPEWEHVSAKVNAARKAIAKALGEQA